MRKLTIAALVAGSLFSSNSFAWGQTGHRITGAIAQLHLSAAAQAEIGRILGVETLAQASTWPDEMRSSPSKFWQKIASPYHYVTIPKGKDYVNVGAPSKGDSVTALTQYTKTLKNDKASLKDKQHALRFIVHIIGDLHQPLHAGNGTDRGGNDFDVEFFWEDSNLHRVWDSGLINRQRLSYTEFTQWLNATITDDDKRAWRDTNPLNWIAESQKIRDNIYPDSHKISWDYQYKHLPTLKMRLKQGGIRIADYLNEVFRQP